MDIQVPLGVLFHSEQYNDDMRDILKEVYQYIPTASSSSSDVEQGDANSFPILFGGDQLTTESLSQNCKECSQ